MDRSKLFPNTSSNLILLGFQKDEPVHKHIKSPHKAYTNLQIKLHSMKFFTIKIYYNLT